MKKQSTKLTKAMFALLMAAGSQAFAKNRVVTLETLVKNELDQQSIQELIDEKILLRTRIENEFRLNNPKVDELLVKSEDQELKVFLVWLKSIVGEDTQVDPKNSGGMTTSSQDGGGMM